MIRLDGSDSYLIVIFKLVEQPLQRWLCSRDGQCESVRVLCALGHQGTIQMSDARHDNTSIECTWKYWYSYNVQNYTVTVSSYI